MRKALLSLVAAAIVMITASAALAQSPNGTFITSSGGRDFFGFNNDEVQINTIKANGFTLGAFIKPNKNRNFGARNGGFLKANQNGDVTFSLSDESLSNFWTSNDIYPVMDGSGNFVSGGKIKSVTSINNGVLVNGKGPVNFEEPKLIGGKKRFEFTLKNEFLMREGGEAFAVYQSKVKNAPVNGLGAVSSSKTITNLFML